MVLFEKSVCFGGCRPDQFPFQLKVENPEYVALQAEITRAIIKAIQDGYSNLFCAMQPGFDLICAGILLEIRDIDPKFNDARLTAVLSHSEGCLSGIWGDVYQGVLERADEVVFGSSRLHPMANLERILYMVERSGRIICYFDGRDGDTAYLVNHALQRGLEIQNLYKRNP